ncbi:hypothetical protein PG984_015162 [Apiospora sp. TS-2023a]
MTAAGGPRRRQDRAYSIPLVCRRQPRMLPSPWTSSSPAQERFCPRGGLPWSYPVAYPGSGNKMGGSEVHGPRATTSLAPAGSPWGGA